MAFPGSRDGGSNESDGDGDGDGIRTENTLWALKAKEGLPQAIIASCSKILMKLLSIQLNSYTAKESPSVVTGNTETI